MEAIFICVNKKVIEINKSPPISCIQSSSTKRQKKKIKYQYTNKNRTR